MIVHATLRDRALKFVCHAGRWIVCSWTVTTLIALIKIVVDKKEKEKQTYHHGQHNGTRKTYMRFPAVRYSRKLLTLYSFFFFFFFKPVTISRGNYITKYLECDRLSTNYSPSLVFVALNAARIACLSFSRCLV